MPSLIDCVQLIEYRCREKGTVMLMPREVLLALKYYSQVLKELCDFMQNHYLWELGDEDDLMATINQIAKEEW